MGQNKLRTKEKSVKAINWIIILIKTLPITYNFYSITRTPIKRSMISSSQSILAAAINTFVISYLNRI